MLTFKFDDYMSMNGLLTYIQRNLDTLTFEEVQEGLEYWEEHYFHMDEFLKSAQRIISVPSEIYVGEPAGAKKPEQVA